MFRKYSCAIQNAHAALYRKKKTAVRPKTKIPFEFTIEKASSMQKYSLVG